MDRRQLLLIEVCDELQRTRPDLAHRLVELRRH
jgi:hypothetical protein